MNASPEILIDNFEDQVVENYDTQNDFSTAVAFRSIKKPLNVNPILSTTDEKRAELLRSMVVIENSTRMAEVGKLSNLELENASPEALLVSVSLSDGKRYFKIDLQSETFALKEFSALIGVPVRFLRTNTSELNVETIRYYLDLKKLSNPDLCLRLFYLNQTSTILNSRSEPVSAYPLLNTLQHGDRQESPALDLDPTEYMAKISNVASALIQRSEQQGIQLRLIRNAATRMNVNGGNQLITLLVENPEHQFLVNGEKYQPLLQIGSCLNLSKRDSMEVRLNFGLMRMACENGLMVGLSKDTLDNLNTDLDEEEKDYLLSKVSTSSALRSPAFRMNTKVFNSALAVNVANTFIQAAIQSAAEAKTLLEAATNTTYEAEPAEMVKAINYAGRKSGMSAKLLKRLSSEYLVGVLDGDESIKTPMDVINFMTFNSRTENTDIIEQTESNAYSFSMDILKQLESNREEESEAQKQVNSIIAGLPARFRQQAEFLTNPDQDLDQEED